MGFACFFVGLLFFFLFGRLNPTSSQSPAARLALCDWRRFSEIGLGGWGDSSGNKRVMKVPAGSKKVYNKRWGVEERGKTKEMIKLLFLEGDHCDGER